ncbi:hypothetical protein QOZ80_3BG0274630 [Eleusine coracana subsp. coracana]|nr:hypothetical protein QOZ80_3BG0274630 [Eleusine coracana subsp. coracana]
MAGPGQEIVLTDASPAPEDFEFCVLSSGGLALAGEDADMCAADEVFSGGKLLPLRLSLAASSDAPSSALLLLRSDSGATSTSGGFSSRYSSRGSCVSRSMSSISDPASLTCSKGASSVTPPRLSAPSSMFYAHPCPSPRPPRRSAVPASSARRSTGSAPPATAWGGVIRLGVVSAPEVYPRRAPGESRWGGSQSLRFEQANAGVPTADRKLGLGSLGAGLVCSCSTPSRRWARPRRRLQPRRGVGGRRQRTRTRRER